MSWEAVAAVGTVASAIVVAVASLAALVQIRHLRTANQLAAILQIYDRLNSAEMVAARRYCFEELPRLAADPRALAETAASGIFDTRVTMVGNFFNELGFLTLDGFLDRRLILSLVPLTERVWQAFAPLALEIRRHRADPVWADFEYVASLRDEASTALLYARFPRAFAERLRREQPARDGAPTA